MGQSSHVYKGVLLGVLFVYVAGFGFVANMSYPQLHNSNVNYSVSAASWHFH